jgi:hypothetical protein
MSHPPAAGSRSVDWSSLTHSHRAETPAARGGDPGLASDAPGSVTREGIPSGRAPGIAFIGWNPFQIRHILDVAQRLENSCILIEKRADHIFKFEEELLTSSGVPVVMVSRKRIKQLDGLFDVIVCQTPFSQMESITKSRIAMIQYGYAKAGHNYGDWRASASLCMVYGEYAARQIRPMCPVLVTGNPAFDKWHDPAFHDAAKMRYGPSLDPSRKTILYAPTWGDLSTCELYLDEVVSLTDEYNVILKLHHNTDLLEKDKRGRMKASAPISFGANASLLELMAVSDVVLSDYSGAIFDALYCKRPVILLQDQTEKRVGEKLNLESLEYAARHQIGPVLEKPGTLRQTISGLFGGGLDFSNSNRELTGDLYLSGPGAAERVANALTALALRK